MSKYTPGPWEVQEGQECCFHPGNRFAVTHSGEDTGEPWSVTIAEIWPTADDSDCGDAYLIAAAPYLLEALYQIQDVLLWNPDDDRNQLLNWIVDAQTIVNAAITKVEER